MDAASAIKGERVIDVRDQLAHPSHGDLPAFERLDDVSSLQLIADHDPKPLRLQLEAKYGNRCRWTYLEQGPELWRVRLQSGRPQIKR